MLTSFSVRPTHRNAHWFRVNGTYCEIIQFRGRYYSWTKCFERVSES